MLEKWNNLKPEVRALTVVIFCGAFGALLSCWWNLSIGEKELASGLATLDWSLRIFLGIFGAAATVFVVAKTDQTKLIIAGSFPPWREWQGLFKYGRECRAKFGPNRVRNEHRAVNDRYA